MLGEMLEVGKVYKFKDLYNKIWYVQKSMGFAYIGLGLDNMVKVDLKLLERCKDFDFVGTMI